MPCSEANLGHYCHKWTKVLWADTIQSLLAHSIKVHSVAKSQPTTVWPPLFQPLWKVVSVGMQMKSAKSMDNLLG